MKLRWVMLLAVTVAGAGVSYHLLGGGRSTDTSDPPEGPTKDKRQVAADDARPKKKEEPAKKKADEPKEEKKPAEEFRLPDDSGGRLVSRVTGPPARLPESKQVAPLRRPAPRSIESPSLPLLPQEASVPRLRDPDRRRPARPELVAPEPVFGLEELIGVLPESLSFPALDRIRLLGVDVSVPVSLPRMALPVVERAALADPTLDMSKAEALAASLPPRDQPVPFIRVVLPDPFEHQDTVRLPSPAEEMPDPNVRPPRK